MRINLLESVDHLHTIIAMQDIKAVVLDMDGVLWIADNYIEGSAEAVRKMASKGIKIFYLTNNSCHSRESLFKKLKQGDFVVDSLNNILTSASLTAQKLKHDQIKGKIYALGSEALLNELSALDDIDILKMDECKVPQFFTPSLPKENLAAIVCGFDQNLCYYRIATVVAALHKFKCPLYCTNSDELFPCNGVMLPATGNLLLPIVNSMPEGHKPIYSGKPNTSIGAYIMEYLNIPATQIAMVGDNLKTDVQFGKNCGFKTVLVESGVNKKEDVLKLGIEPTFVFNDLAEFGRKIANLAH